MMLFNFPWENSWGRHSILFDRITPKKDYSFEIALPSYSNSSGKAHLNDYWANYGCISAFSSPRPSTEHQERLELLIYITRIKSTQKHCNLRRGKKDSIPYFQAKKSHDATFLFILCSKNVLSTRHFNFFELILETREVV